MPLMTARATGMSHAGSKGSATTRRSDSSIATAPATLTEHTYNLALDTPSLIGPIGGMTIEK